MICKVSGEGTIGLAGKVLRVGRAHEGRMVTVLIEQHRIRVLDGDTELITHPWNGSMVTQYRPAKRAKRREPSNES